jgi:hypothetical protein
MQRRVGLNGIPSLSSDARSDSAAKESGQIKSPEKILSISTRRLGCKRNHQES